MRREQGRRLRAAREHWNLPTAKAGAEFLKLSNETTYQHHENGNRGMGRAVAEYALKYGVAEEWLLRGRNPPDWARPDVEPTTEERQGDADHYIRAWRLYRQLSPQDLADRLGIPVDMITSWEAGLVEVSDKWLRKLAEVLSTTPGTLLDIDPANVAPSILETWRAVVEEQRATRARAVSLQRTGTTG